MVVVHPYIRSEKSICLYQGPYFHNQGPSQSYVFRQDFFYIKVRENKIGPPSHEQGPQCIFMQVGHLYEGVGYLELDMIMHNVT